MDHSIGSLFPELERELQELTVHGTTGILPSQAIEDLINRRHISAPIPIESDQIQPASLDLRLGDVAYRVNASFLPGPGSSVRNKLNLFKMHEVDLSGSAVLETGCVYIIPLLEELDLPREISAKANPKSSTGRLDILTRLITDYGAEFEGVKNGYKGKLYVEVVPRTFSIVVQKGTKLNQIRFLKGNPRPADSKLEKLDEQGLVYRDSDLPIAASINKGLWISIDLAGCDGADVVGYKAKHHVPLIDLSKTNYYEPMDFWEPIARPSGGHIVLNPNDFYILVSKERIRVPPGFSAAMVPYDPSVGEFRIHYAGFFDPGFGYGSNDITGTRAVLEVRSHEVPFLLEDGQAVGRLIYEQLQDVPRKIYGVDIGSSYQHQGLALGKHFKRT